MVQPGKIMKMLLFHQEQPDVPDLKDGVVGKKELFIILSS